MEINRFELSRRYFVVKQGGAKEMANFLKYLMQNIKDNNVRVFVKSMLEQVKTWVMYQTMSHIPGMHNKNVVDMGYYDYRNMPGFDQKEKMLMDMLGIDNRFKNPDLNQEYNLLCEYLQEQNGENFIQDVGLDKYDVITVNNIPYAVLTKEELSELGEDFSKIAIPFRSDSGKDVFVIQMEEEMEIRLKEYRDVHKTIETEIPPVVQDNVPHTESDSIDEPYRQNTVIPDEFNREKTVNLLQANLSCGVITSDLEKGNQILGTDTGFECQFDKNIGGFIITGLPDYDTDKLVFPENITNTYFITSEDGTPKMEKHTYPVVGINIKPDLDKQMDQVKTVHISKNITFMRGLNKLPNLETITGFSRIKRMTGPVFTSSMNINSVVKGKNLIGSDYFRNDVYKRFTTENVHDSDTHEAKVDKEPLQYKQANIGQPQTVMYFPQNEVITFDAGIMEQNPDVTQYPVTDDDYEMKQGKNDVVMVSEFGNVEGIFTDYEHAHMSPEDIEAAEQTLKNMLLEDFDSGERIKPDIEPEIDEQMLQMVNQMARKSIKI